MMEIQGALYYIAIGIVPALLAITLHETAHGWVAYQLGDPTAKQLGRLSANPLKHIDPVGTIIMPVTLLVIRMITGFGFVFGYAKPVPVDIRHFKQPELDMALVGLAGPMSNFLMAIGWAVFIKLNLLLFADAWFVPHLIMMADIGIFVNLLLIVINMTPIPPLDGGRVIAGVLPRELARFYGALEPYGIFIFILLVIMTPLGGVLARMLIYYHTLIMQLFDFKYRSVLTMIFSG